MKYFFLLSLLFLSLLASSQRRRYSHSKFYAAVSLSPDYSYRSLSNPDGSNAADAVINSRNETENPGFGYTGRILLGLHVHRKVSIESGLQYSTESYKTKKFELIVAPPPGPIPQSYKAWYRFSYISVPLIARYHTGENGFMFMPGAGLLANFLTKTRQENRYVYTDGHQEKTEKDIPGEFRKLQIGIYAGAGLGYELNKRTILTVEPHFHYNISKLVDAPVAERLWNAGLNVGVMYRLP